MTQDEPVPPLVVDLDGTLIRSDLLIESFFGLLARHPLKALGALGALGRGKAAFKAHLAADCTLDWQTMPLNEELVGFLRAEKAAGRRLYLASASDHGLVQAVADALGLFDGVFASDGATNLAGQRKTEALVAAFGTRGFDYAGNAAVDMEVWQAAQGVIVVGAGASFRRRTSARFPHARHFDPPQGGVRVWLRAIRIHQWLKNLLIFAAAGAAHTLSSAQLPQLLCAFFSFSFAASSAYLTNDLLDLPGDRSHARKRHRPLASGRIPLITGIQLAPLLLIAAIALSFALPPLFLLVLAGYYFLTLSYSLFLKRKLIVDVVTLACLYGVRLVAGAVAVGVALSPWFASFAVFFFLCLALVKRCTEIVDRMARGGGDLSGRAYVQHDLPILEAMAAATGYVAIMIFTLYINSPAVVTLYHHPQYLWAICLVLFYWISRILLLTHRGEMHEDPVVYAVSDRKSLICGAVVLAIILAAI